MDFSESPCDKRRLEEFITSNACCIAVASLYELMINPNNGPDRIRALGEFLADRGILVAAKTPSTIPDDFIVNLSLLSDEQLDCMKAAVIQDKIDYESRFAALHLDLCLLLGMCLYMEDRFSGEYDMGRVLALCETYCESHGAKARTVFAAGYAEGSCENGIARGLGKILADELIMSLAFLRGIEEKAGDASFDLEIWAGSDEFEEVRKAVSKAVNRTSTPYKFLEKKAKRHQDAVGTMQYERFLEKLRGVFESKTTSRALEIYLGNALRNSLQNGARFRKNDLIDAVILGYLEQVDGIITFDGGLLKALETGSASNTKYCRSLEVIQSLR